MLYRGCANPALKPIYSPIKEFGKEFKTLYVLHLSVQEKLVKVEENCKDRRKCPEPCAGYPRQTKYLHV